MHFPYCGAAILVSLTCFPGILATPVARRSSPAGKRGLPYNSAAVADLFAEYSDQITWAYNWGYNSEGLSRSVASYILPNTALTTPNSNFEYVPLLYSDPTGNAEYISGWQAGAASAIANGSTHLLAFNEPDINNLTPAQAATAYLNYMQPFASGTVKLGAPAVTQGGVTWLEEFLGNCTQCTVDFVPFHWYCGYDMMLYFTETVDGFYAAGGERPLWITEFQADDAYCSGVSATDEQQVEFMDTILPWLDSLSEVERYSYFAAIDSTSSNVYLVEDDGVTLSASGLEYATLDTVNGTVPTALVD